MQKCLFGAWLDFVTPNFDDFNVNFFFNIWSVYPQVNHISTNADKSTSKLQFTEKIPNFYYVHHMAQLDYKSHPSVSHHCDYYLLHIDCHCQAQTLQHYRCKSISTNKNYFSGEGWLPKLEKQPLKCWSCSCVRVKRFIYFSTNEQICIFSKVCHQGWQHCRQHAALVWLQHVVDGADWLRAVGMKQSY